MIPIKIVKNNNPIPVNNIGDILFPFESWDTTLTGGGWYSKVTDEFYENKLYYPLNAVDLNSWSALGKLGVDYSSFKKSVEYICPYNGYIHYWCLPILIFAKDIKNWTARYKVYREEMYHDVEWMRKFYPSKVKSTLPFSKIQRSLLGPGYTGMTLVNDGSGYLYDTLLSLDNGDFIGAKVWIWFNK